MMTIPMSRWAGYTAILVTLLTGPQIVSAQPQPTLPSTSRIVDAPVGHRQPRPADIPPADKAVTEQLEEKQQADLNRKLRICRGC